MIVPAKVPALFDAPQPFVRAPRTSAVVCASMIRLVGWATLMWYIWSAAYVPHRNEPALGTDFELAVNAINAGRPFELLYPATNGAPESFRSMSDLPIDQGAALLLGAGSAGFHFLTGRHAVVSASSGWTVMFWIFAATTAAMVSPAVPLAVSIAALVSIGVLFAVGPMTLGPPVHWGVAFVVLVGAVYAGFAVKPWTPLRVITITILAALGAVSQLLRQEAAGVSYACGIGLVFAAAAAWWLILEHAPDADRGTLRAVARRACVAGLLLILANASVRPLERWWISRALGTRYGDTPAIEHGSGWPLYLSLGYVSNPLNIAWRDPIGQVHARLINPNLAPGNAPLQSTLVKEFARVVVERPWLLVENLLVKALRVHRLALRHANPLPDVAVWQRPAHAALYMALPAILAFSIGALWWRGTPETVAILLGLAGATAAACAGSLVVFPDYMGGVQGAIAALGLIMPAAVVSSIDFFAAPAAQQKAARSMLIFSAALIVAAIGAGAAFVALQWIRHRSAIDATTSRNPVEAIEAAQFRYAHTFNELPVARQGRIIAELTLSHDPRVARTVDLRRGDVELFRPEAVIRTHSQLHLLVWLGRSFRAPFPPLYQGTTHSLFFICGECGPEATVNDFPFDSGWTFINDLEWRDRYRMFSVPLNPKLEAARFFHVAGERIVALDRQIESTGLRSAPISSARLSY